MLSHSLVQLLLSCSPAIGSVLAQQGDQQPWSLQSSSSSSFSSASSDSKAPAYRSALLALHKQLIEIPSTTGLEHDVGDFLVDYFISKSWNYEIQPVEPFDNTPEGKDRFNVLAWPPGPTDNKKRPDPVVLVTSHIDCVPPHIPYSISDGPVTNDTVISGRCSVDAKGSVAAQITAVDALLATGALAPQDVLLLFVVGEERDAAGMRAFSAATRPSLHRLRAAVFGEPTENKLACGHKGGSACLVTATGKAGHSGYPWLGKSATEVLMRGLVKVLDTDLGSSAEYGNTTVNVGILEGGVAANVIPALAKAQLTIRVAVGPEDSGHEIVLENLRKALASVDDEALALDCLSGVGVVKCDCNVNGKFEDTRQPNSYFSASLADFYFPRL